MAHKRSPRKTTAADDGAEGFRGGGQAVRTRRQEDAAAAGDRGAAHGPARHRSRV